MSELDVVEKKQLLLKIDEAAQTLNISRAHLYNLINKGLIHPIHLGRSVRISRIHIERLIEQKLNESRISEKEN